jgi:hypothetical protein
MDLLLRMKRCIRVTRIQRIHLSLAVFCLGVIVFIAGSCSSPASPGVLPPTQASAPAEPTEAAIEPAPEESEPTKVSHQPLPTNVPGEPTFEPTKAANPPTVAPSPQPAIQEARRLVLDFPPTIRVGGSDVVKLVLEMDDQGDLTPTAEVSGHKVEGEKISIPNLYETHHVLAEARLDMAGVQVVPNDTISEPLLPGKSAIFYWSVSPYQTGNYRGTVWCHLKFLPKEGGNVLDHPIFARTIQIKSITLLGLSVVPAKLLGSFGAILGTVIGFPFLEDILKLIIKKLKSAA